MNKIILCTVVFASIATFSSAQNFSKAMLLLELGGHHTTFEETIDQGIKSLEKSFFMGPKVGVGLNFGNDLFCYLNLGYGFGKDSVQGTYLANNQPRPYQESIRSKAPMFGFGFTKFIRLGNTPIYFNTDLAINVALGSLEGTLYYRQPWTIDELVTIKSEGQYTNLTAGLSPGLTASFKKGWFVNISVGFLGYAYTNRSIVYKDGYDETSTANDFLIDFTGSSIKLRGGLMF